MKILSANREIATMALVQSGPSIDRSRLISADDAYRVLELDRGASLHAIRRAYLRQILRHHPDKAGASAGDPDAVTSAKSRTIRINVAYEMLQSDKIATRDRSQAERPRQAGQPGLCRQGAAGGAALLPVLYWDVVPQGEESQ